MAAPGPFFIDSHVLFPSRQSYVTADQDGSSNGRRLDSIQTETKDQAGCGLGIFRPRCIQPLATMSMFVGVNSINALMTSILGLYLVSQITTIEKEFGLNSSQSGFLLSCNDIGFLLTTLFASYVARKVHIPMILSFTAIVYGLAGIVCSLPYFISKDAFIRENEEQLYSFNVSVETPGVDAREVLCFKDGRLGNDTGTCVDGVNTGIGLPNKYTSGAIGLLAFGMIVQGMAKGPRYAFSTAYIDDNGSKKKTALYMGVLYGVAVFGPATAFGIGSAFSRLYVTLDDVSITPEHPAWIGAWWIGFLVTGVLSIVVATPIACFPRFIGSRTPASLESSRVKDAISVMGVRTYITGFGVAMKRLLKNPVYSLLLAGHVVFSLMMGGSSAFIVKYVETQFFVPTWKANILLGMLVVLSACLGSVLGGYVVTRKQLSPFTCLKILTLVTGATGILHCLGYVFGCDTPNLIGGLSLDGNTRLGENCWGSCDCDADDYFPVCGSDGRNYFSPCFAGCQDRIGETYTGCDCVLGVNTTASPGLCKSDCRMLYPFLGMLTMALFLGTFGSVPSFIVLIRCVEEDDKALAIGLSSFAGTLLGLIPGPIIFGKLVDNACLVWTKSCSTHGACAVYDNSTFRISKASFDVIPKLIGLILNVLTVIVARKKLDWSTEERTRDVSTRDTDVLIKEPTLSTMNQPLSEDSRL